MSADSIVPPLQNSSLLRRWNGSLTDELALRTGDFGLGKVPARLKPEAVTRSVCGFCSTGCSLDIHLQSGAAVNLSPSADYPVNLGMACPKGWEALTCLSAPDRATAPMLRKPDGSFAAVSWDDAMREFVTRFKSIMAAHGPESVAFLSTGQICTEEMALLGALWKFGMGAIHCDSNTRQCMATAHVAYKESLGFDSPPFTYADFELSDTLVFIGANPCIAHPIMWQRVLRNKKNPQIIVIDPRRTETAMSATHHLALRPKSDLTLLYGIANLLIHNGWLNRGFIERHTVGFAEFAAFAREFTPDRVAAETGLTVGELYRFATAIHRGRAVSFWWTMGVNQSHESTRTAQAIINLALMTGNIGRPGTGANSITGQCNAMGSRIFANVTSLLGGRKFQSVEHRAQVAEILGIPIECIPAQNSLAYDEIIDRIRDGKIKALWVIGTNPAHSWIARGQSGKGSPNELRIKSANQPSPDESRTAARSIAVPSALPSDGRREGQGEVRALNLTTLESVLDNLDFLVVQDMFTTTDTAKRAHLILPAGGWGEKNGQMINSERRIGLVKKVARAPGLALSDFNIFRLIAKYWGCDGMFAAWDSPEATFQILKRLSASLPCDFTGIRDFAHLEEASGIQWPWSAGETDFTADDTALPPPERRLFADGKFFHADGKARFIFDSPRGVAEPADDEFPFILLTGRGTSAQWHTNTRTGKSAVLRTLYPENPYVEINPEDAERLHIAANSMVTIISRRARVQCAAFLTATVSLGQIFVPMHYEITNLLTRAEFNPHSRQPSYKHCAVRLERITLDSGKPRICPDSAK